MNKWLIYLCCWPLLSFGQISFVKEYPTTHYFSQIAKAELNNGNYICSVLIQDNEFLYNRLLLLDKCGELLTNVIISHGDDYMFINSIIDLDSSTFLATGFLYDSLFKIIYLEMDNQTLEVKKQVQHIETSLYYMRSFFEDGKLNQVGTDKGYRLVSSRLNQEYQRNLHLYKVFDEVNYLNLKTSRYYGYSNHSLYQRESYSDPEISNYPWEKIRCVNQKLGDRYIIGGHTDSTYTTFGSRIIFLGGDTLLLVANVRSISGTVSFVRQYVQDEIIYERPLGAEDNFSTYSTCFYSDGKIKCISYDSEIAEFNSLGELEYYDDHLKDIFTHGELASALQTHDGGFFGTDYAYNEQQGHLVRFVKLTSDYQILDHPSPECIVGTEDVLGPAIGLIYPNPSLGTIHVQCEYDVIRYQVFNMNAHLVYQGADKGKEFDIHLNLPPGNYFIKAETARGWFTQKLLIVD